MAYIGRGLDKISNIEHLDTITFDGSSSYSLTKSSSAFTPNSAQSLLVSIDGVVQSNNFTVSGSTIDFGVAVPSTSTCDFIKHFGTGVAFTPADGTVLSAQLGTGAITGQTEDTTPADDDLILVYDTSATALKKVQKSNFASQGVFESALLHVRDEKSNGTGGGATTTGSFNTRDLNTVVTNEISGSSLSSNQITLPSGTYFITCFAPFYDVDKARMRFYNATDATSVIDSIVGNFGDAGNVAGLLRLGGRFTIASSKAFEIQYQVQTVDGNGLGAASGFGGNEIYTDVYIFKVA